MWEVNRVKEQCAAAMESLPGEVRMRLVDTIPESFRTRKTLRTLIRDPSTEGNDGIRILAAGRSGVYEYVSDPMNPFRGRWRVLSDGFEPSIHFSRVEPVPWIGHVAFDPRPGVEHVVYACKSADPEMCRAWRTRRNPNLAHSNGQARRPLYRSVDGGRSWQSLHAPNYHDIPDHLDVTALEVAPDGSLYVDGYCGLYILPGVSEPCDRDTEAP
jgi:hypothetical protein